MVENIESAARRVLKENWYLVRTKPRKERWVCDQLGGRVDEVFLPMLRTWRRQRGKMAEACGPLFPCYLFARFDLGLKYFEVKYMAGVHGLVSAGSEPLAVPNQIVDEIKARGSGGIVEIVPRPLSRGQAVTVTQGPFQGLEAVFERYLAGTARVAVLLETIAQRGVRVLLPADHVAQNNG